MLKPFSTDTQALWKQRFRIANLSSCQIALNNPDRGIVCANIGGVYQLHAWDVPTGTLRQLTYAPQGNFLGAISPDGRFVYFALDSGGNQYGHFVRIPYEGGPILDLTPDFPPYPLSQICISATGNLLAFGVPRPAYEGTDLYVISLGEQVGQPQHIFHDPIPGLYGRKRLALSADGALLIFVSNERSPTMFERMLAFDTQTGELINELTHGAQNSVSTGDFSPIPDDTRVLAKFYQGDTVQNLLWDPRTGEQRMLDWELDGYVTPLTWTPDGMHLLLYQMHEAGTRYVFYSLADGSKQPMNYVRGLSWFASFGRGNTLYAIVGGYRPAEMFALDRASGEVKGIVLSGGSMLPERPWTSITFPSSDGQEIQAWLITPEGTGPFPTIMFVHGGPREWVVEGYAPHLQLWVDHGFAVCAINYRGSIGFGLAFQEKVVGDPGHWEMEDIIAGRNLLIEQNIARADAILLTGWSYGGYLTLLALGKFPELWAGGMAGYAVADWTALAEEAESGTKPSVFFGGTLQEMPEQYRISSPITYAEQVQAPLFIYQGRNDPGCTPGQMKHYVKHMQALGKQIECVWIETGHGTLDFEQEIATQELLLRFAYRTLGL